MKIGNSVSVISPDGREMKGLCGGTRIPYEVLLMGSRIRRIYIGK